MSFYKNYATALQAEFIKKQGTGTYWFCFGFGIFTPLLYAIIQITQIKEKVAPAAISYNYYEKVIGESTTPFLYFFFPILIIIIASKITQIDHKNGGWQLMETQPLSKLAVYLSKFTILFTGNIIAILSFLVGMVIAIWFTTFFVNVPENVSTSIPLLFVGKLGVRMLVSVLFLSAIQFVISVLFSSFIVPILIGFFGFLGTFVLDKFQIYRVWNPFTILSRTADNAFGSDLGYFFLYTEWISLVGFLLVFIVGFIWFKNKTFKRTFFKTKNLVQVLAVVAIGLVGIVFLISPNAFEKQEKTIISGVIDTDQQVSKVYLIDEFTQDTLYTIPVTGGRFHAVIEGDLPLQSYAIVFNSQIPLQMPTYMSSGDSTYIEAKYFKGETEGKIEGTRLAENKYQPTRSQRSFVNYLLQDNYYLSDPQVIVDQLYSEWERESNELNDFRTKDNYVPQADFVQLVKKNVSLKFLSNWNTFETKLRATDSEFVKNTPSKIQMIKDQIDLDDHSLISQQDYIAHLIYELTKNDTTDIDIHHKKMNAVLKIEGDQSFKDRLLFNVLQTALDEVSTPEERQNLMHNYADEIRTVRLNTLIHHHFVKKEKMARGNFTLDFIAQNLEGNDVKLSDFRGKYVLIDVWATWCGPCKFESPHFERIAIKHKAKKDIAFIALSVDKKKDSWYLDAKGKSESVLQLHIAGEEERKFASYYDLTSIPRFIFIDKEGRLIEAYMNSPSGNGFEYMLENEINKN